MFPLPKVQDTLKTLAIWLHRGFDTTALWVTQLSWWKFLMFASIALIAGSVLQEELFSPGSDEEVVLKYNKPNKKNDGNTNILIDDNGINFNPRGKLHKGDADSDKPEVAAIPEPAEPPEPPEAPEPPEKAEKPSQPAKSAKTAKPAAPAIAELPGDEVHIPLPPQIGEALSNAIEEAVDDAAEQKVTRYHKQASTWFRSFVFLLVLALFGTKALMGGKKRAEAETLSANAAAERASMQRQLSEAKMQMMQAQVEPHFLFNAGLGRVSDRNRPAARLGHAAQPDQIFARRAAADARKRPGHQSGPRSRHGGRLFEPAQNAHGRAPDGRFRRPRRTAHGCLSADDAAIDGGKRHQAWPGSQARGRHVESAGRGGAQQAARDRHRQRPGLRRHPQRRHRPGLDDDTRTPKITARQPGPTTHRS